MRDAEVALDISNDQMDQHLFLILFLGALSGLLTPLAMNFVFRQFNEVCNLAAVTVRLLPKLLLATVLAIVTAGVVVLGPLYLFGLIPLLGFAPLYGLSFLVGGVLSKAIFWRQGDNGNVFK